MSNQVPIYSQVLPKSHHQRANARQSSRAFSSLRHDPRTPQPGVGDPGFDPLNHNHGGNFGNVATADGHARVEKFARESARRSAREAARADSARLHHHQHQRRQPAGPHVRQAEHRINLRSLSLNESAVSARPQQAFERTPTQEFITPSRLHLENRDLPLPNFTRESSSRDLAAHHYISGNKHQDGNVLASRDPYGSNKLHLSGVSDVINIVKDFKNFSTRDFAAGRDAIYENDGGVRGYVSMRNEVMVPDSSNRVHSVRRSASSHKMAGQGGGNCDRRRFFCREWAFQKLAHCLEQRPVSKTCGALILGDAGSGKTALCRELAQPGSGPTARQQRALQRRMIARHFLQGQNENSLTMGEFIRTLVMQILSHSTHHRHSSSSLLNTKEGSNLDTAGSDGTQGLFVTRATPSAPPLDQIDQSLNPGESVSEAGQRNRRPRHSTMERIHERDHYDDLMTHIPDTTQVNQKEEECLDSTRPPPRVANTNPFLPNFQRTDERQNQLYENHENVFLRNASQQHPKDSRNSRLYRQQSEPPLNDKKTAVLQKSLSTDSKNNIAISIAIDAKHSSSSALPRGDVNVSDNSDCGNKSSDCSKNESTDGAKTSTKKETAIDNSFNSPVLSPSSNAVTNSSKVSRIPVASFKYPNMSALSSAENSPSKNRIARDNFERNSASDNSDNTRESSSCKSNKETGNKQPVIVSIIDNINEGNNTEAVPVIEDELPEYQNVLKPPSCPKELSPKVSRLEQFNLGEFVRLDETVLNSPDYDPNPFDVRKLLSADTKRTNGKIDAISPSKANIGDDVPPPIPSLPVNPRTLIANYYYEKLLSEPEIQQALLPHNLEKNPDDCFKKALLFPLLEIDPPKQCLFLLVDSIDESPLIGSSVTNSTLTKDRDKNGSDSGNLAIRSVNSSKTIAELLANHHHLFPQWLLLVCTARKQSKYLTKMFTGFRKISLDDLRKNHVTLDVQRYILARLDGEARLRQHVSRDAAQALDHLRIKSNGCFLYLERVLDGLADGSVALREIREIPGTLNGLYLWLCQRLFHGRKFAKVQPLLNVLLAAKCGVDAEMLHKCLLTTNYTISREEFNKRLHLLKRILTADAASGTLSIFHHSFSEWLLDVKHCTRRFLCNATAGHGSLAMHYTLKGKSLTVQEIHALVTHMTRVEAGRKTSRDRDSKSIDASSNQDQHQLTSTTSLETSQNSSDRLLSSSSSPNNSPVDYHTLMLLWILDCGCPVETSLRSRPPVVPNAMSNATIGGLTVGNGAPSESGSSGAERSIGRSPGEDSINRHSSTHSLGGTSTTALNVPSWTIPEFLSGFYCPTLPRDSRVLRALLEMGARTTESVSSPPRPNTPNALQDQVTASQISLEHLLMLEAEEEAALEELAEQSSRTQEEALSLFTLDPLTGRAPVHMLAQTGDTITLAQALQAYVSAGGDVESIETADRAGQTALQLAARGGRREAVSLLLERGARADRADSEGWTPLRAAAWGGHTEVVELLLKHGCEVDCVDSDHRTALRAAAWSGHEEIVRLLLSHGADVNKTDLEGRTALIAAAYMGHTDIVNHLLDHGAHIDHADSDGRTALAVAALCSSGGGGGGGGCAQLLLERGAAPATPDKDGMTPLLVAAFEGHREVIELLLEAEADPEASDKAGRTPLWAAAAAGHAPAVRTLLFWGCCVDTIDQDGRTVLSVAAAQGSVEVVRQLVDRGLDEHHRDNAGWTPLHFAAFEGHLEVCDVLLEAGAKVDETDNDGKAPLMLAAQEGHCRLMELLMDEWAAPVDQHSHDGKTALRVAALEGHYEAVRILVERGACVDSVDADQRSTLYILALDNRISMAKYLMQRAGANVETRDSEGRTPLHVSAWQGHYEMVNLLLTVGGSLIDALDGERRTPLHSASWRGQAAVVRLLLSKGADPHAQCDQGATPLGIASQEGHEECVLWLLQHGANPKHSDHCGRTPAKVALRAGHLHVCRLLERWGATPSNQQIITNISISSQPDQSGGTNTSGSTAETKACTASLSNARLSPLPTAQHNQGSPDSKRRSVHSSNSTKSSSNLTSSTVSSSQQEVPPVPPPHSRAPLPITDTQLNGTQNRTGLALSFAQQVARCGRRGGGGITSPLYATPPHSPLSDVCSPTQPTQPPSSSGLGILSSIAHQFGSSQQQPRAPQAADVNSTDRHFCRDTHMRIILGRENKHSPPTAGEHASREARDRDRDREGSRMSCRKLVGSIGKIARRRKTSSPVVGGKTKRNGIVTNPAMRLVANVRNGLDTAAANIRRTGVALAASASSNNPAVKTNAFQWKRETPL